MFKTILTVVFLTLTALAETKVHLGTISSLTWQRIEAEKCVAVWQTSPSVLQPFVWYKLDETSDNSYDVADSAGTATGTASDYPANMTVAGIDGTAFSFNGSSDNIEISSVTGVGPSFTFSVFVNPTDQTGNIRYILDSESGRIVLANIDGNTFTGVGYYSTATASWKQSDIALQADVWSLVTFVFNASENIGIMYINGIAVAQEYYGGDSFGGITKIGSAYDSLGGFFSGALDDVRIYSTALTPDQVALLYDSYFPAPPSPFAWYKMDDNDESYDVLDYSGASRTASLNVNTSSKTAIGLVGESLTSASEGGYFYPPSAVRAVLSSASSFSMWIRLSEFAPLFAVFGSDGGSYNSYCWCYLPGKQINLGMGGDNYSANDVGMVSSDWNQFTFVNDGSSMKVYINGEFAVSAPITGYSVDNWRFLNAWDGNYAPIDVDEIKFFDSPLSQGQVRTLFKSYSHIPVTPISENITVTFDASTYGYADYYSYDYLPNSYFYESIFPSAYSNDPAYYWTGYWVDYNTMIWYDYSSQVPTENVTLTAEWAAY